MTSPELPEPPEGFLRYPAGAVIALMPDADAVSSAMDDLTGAGFPRDQMYVLVGPEGADRLDVTGRHHGLLGRIYRILGRLGDDHEELARAADHLRGGGVALRFPSSEERTAVAARILREHGVSHAAYMGKTTFQSLDP